MSLTVEDRIQGSLLGLAWGDVLGSPVEGWHADQIAQVYGTYKKLPAEYPYEAIAPLGAPIYHKLRPLGLHSDDTQQALALIDVCLAPEGWKLENWAAWLVAGRKRGVWRGTGRNFNSAVAKMKRGYTPQTAGSLSAGLGAAMRAGPLGAIYRDRPD